MSFTLPYAVMQAAAAAYAAQLGASPQIVLYSGAVPANATASLGSAVPLATLMCPATPISGYSDTASAARAIWAAISAVTVAATGAASFFRTLDSAGTTVKDQGEIGVAASGKEMILNTTALTAGSSLAISSRNTDFPYL